MTLNDDIKTGSSLVPRESISGPLVTRSIVTPGKEYKEYLNNLRYDFFYSCAYCTMSEAEAQAIRFVIDHYEPRKAHPDLEHVYENLMYSCDECNMRKGDRCPPPNARADNYRFFRPDQDIREEHFELVGIRLESKSNVGYYSIEALDLNRRSLWKLREVRKRLIECEKHVAEGIIGLRKFRIDRLPPSIKGAAARAIRKAVLAADRFTTEIDDILREHARSQLIEADSKSPPHSQERAEKLKRLQALYPGSWRAPRKKRR